MVSNQHYIELFVHGELLELESQDSLNLRLNSVLFDPTKTVTKQGEYSYSFDIPSTPNNDRILGYANTLSKINKFHTRYNAEVYADGTLLFEGSLTIRKYDGASKMYECNLVNIKVKTLEDIFGDSVMTDVDNWKVDYDGTPTINHVNSSLSSTKYFFPFVSYGVFQKDYYAKDAVGADYTPKHQIDEWNKFYHSSFLPSLNVMETMKKCFEWKGYNVGGTAFRDPNINNIYASCNLADEQLTKYNIGADKFGYVNILGSWTTKSANTYSFQDLKFPYSRIRPAVNASNRTAQEQYNFSSIRWYNMLSKNEGCDGKTVNDTYMYNPNNQSIVIPQDGWYRIYLYASATLDKSVPSFKAYQWTTTYYDGDEFTRREVDIDKGLKNLTPFEIQIIRNYDDNIELIKGKWNIVYGTGVPRQEYYTYQGGSYTGSTVPNATAWTTSYPHEDFCGEQPPTKYDSITSNAVASNIGSGGNTFDRGRDGGRNFGTTGGVTYGGWDGDNSQTSRMVGYVYNDGSVMPYDPVVSEGFICGFSSLGNGTMSVMRRGKSWSRECAIKNMVLSNVDGLPLVYKDGTVSATSYSYNSYPMAQNRLTATDNYINGAIECLVYLNRNDIIEVVGILRDYELVGRHPDVNAYDISCNFELKIKAISERREEELRADPNFNVYSPTEFPTQLNLFDFTNEEMKVSEWIQNIQKALNLDIVQDGNQIEINTNQGLKKTIQYAVDIDDRVSNGEASTESISYPKEMSVRYKIDTDEWGFELTVPQEHINDNDWKEWGDSGFTVIELSDDTYETKSQNTSTQFSYTYYDDFLWKEILDDGSESGLERTIRIPVIEKSEYMAEGYNYEEAMKHDGLSLTQRFWYRPDTLSEYVWTSDNMRDECFLAKPINYLGDFNLSYKDSEKSIATEYFNIYPMLSSNYVKVDVYLTPKEYNDIKNGALVHFDSDLYYVSEISGYDATGNNKTELKLIKKV